MFVQSKYPAGSYPNQVDTCYNIWHQWTVWQVMMTCQWRYITKAEYKEITGLDYPDLGPGKDSHDEEVQEYLKNKEKDSNK